MKRALVHLFGDYVVQSDAMVSVEVEPLLWSGDQA